MSNASGSHAAHKHSPAQPLLPPPGFETMFMNERGKLKDCFDAFVLSVHNAIIRGGLRLRIADTNPTGDTIPVGELTEMLPANWTERITAKLEEGTERPMKLLVLRYWDQAHSNVHYEVKILEVVKNQTVVVILFRAVNAYGLDGNVQVANRRDIDSNSRTRNSAGTNFQIQDYILYNDSNGQLSTDEGATAANKSWFEIYKNISNIETLVWTQLMEAIGLTITNQPQKLGVYDSKTSSGSQNHTQQQQQRSPQPQATQPFVPLPDTVPQPPIQPFPTGGIGGPLYIPPGVPTGGGLGRSDLDPLGGFGGGMVADPRGLRTPFVTPFVPGLAPPPPGARFDPFGPPNPTPNPTPHRPPPGVGGNWAVPNPDTEQPPPGFDDMFM